MNPSNLSPWNVRESDLPSPKQLKSQIKFLLRYAILAPSGHNSQPWSFYQDGQHLELRPNFAYARPAIDPDNRELFISLGAAATNLSIAADHFGLIYQKSYSSRNQAVVFDFKNGHQLAKNSDLFRAITQRHTNRFDFQAKLIPKNILKSLPKSSDPKLTYISNSLDKTLLGKLVYDSTIVWQQSLVIVDELKTWVKNDLEGPNDGLSLSTGFSFNPREIIPKAESNQKQVLASPLLILLSTKKDDIQSWIEVGEAYELLALCLTSLGLVHGFFNNVVELKSTREKLNKMFKLQASAQLLLRVGYPTLTPPHSPRRPLKSFLVK